MTRIVGLLLICTCLSETTALAQGQRALALSVPRPRSDGDGFPDIATARSDAPNVVFFSVK